MLVSMSHRVLLSSLRQLPFRSQVLPLQGRTGSGNRWAAAGGHTTLFRLEKYSPYGLTTG